MSDPHSTTDTTRDEYTSDASHVSQANHTPGVPYAPHAPNDPRAPRISYAPQAPRVPELIDIEQVSEGWVNKYLLHYRKPDGSPYTYESVSRKKLDEYRKELMHNATVNSSNQGTSEPRDQSTQKPQGQSTCDSPIQCTCDSPSQSAFCDGVCIVPELPDGSYLLIKEFRYPLNAFCAAFPAGLIDPGETPEAAIDRELQEETGYRVRTEEADAIRMLSKTGFSSTGMTDENIQIAFVKAKIAGAAQPEPSELIEPFTLKRTDIRAFLDETPYLLGTRTQLILELLAVQ